MDELSRDDQLRTALGAEAREHVLAWSVEKAVAIVEEVVASVLANRSKAKESVVE
jgi:hypothetical protein